MRSCIASTRSLLPPSARNPAWWGISCSTPARNPVCLFVTLDPGDRTVEAVSQEAVSIFHDKASAEQSKELAADYVCENLGEFELTLTEAAAGKCL
jgi:hypothetical protein